LQPVHDKRSTQQPRIHINSHVLVHVKPCRPMMST
jgi:hypothetical protein